MRRIFFSILAGFTLVIVPLTTYSQVANANKQDVITVDSLKSGNYKDVFISFFQLAVNDLAGPQKSLSFSSNPYAILAKANPDVSVDSSYVRYQFLRRLNFNFAVVMDSSYRLSGFSVGAKYAILNMRDYTVSHAIITELLKETQIDSFNSYLGNSLTDPSIPFDEKKKIRDEIHKWNNDTTAKYTYDSLSKETQTLVQKVVADHNLEKIKELIEQHTSLSLSKQNKIVYDAAVAKWLKRPLWTIEAQSKFSQNSTSTNNDLVASYVYLTSEFLWGITSPKNTVSTELDCVLSDSITTDRTLSTQNLNRNILSFEPGLNFVIRSARQGKSLFELKLSGTYYHTLSKLYASQSADSSTINAQIRVRVINDLWVPFTLKMDQNGHIRGTLDLKLNFTTLGSLFAKK
jgi:hypothetical protein